MMDVSEDGLREVVERVEKKEGGAIVGSCRDPLGGTPLAIAVLPIDKVEPTPFQRDLSEAHHKKLAAVIQKTGTFLDPWRKKFPTSSHVSRNADSHHPTCARL